MLTNETVIFSNEITSKIPLKQRNNINNTSRNKKRHTICEALIAKASSAVKLTTIINTKVIS